MSCSTKATRSAGVRESRITTNASPTASPSKASRSGSIPSTGLTMGSGTWVSSDTSRRVLRARNRLRQTRPTTVVNQARRLSISSSAVTSLRDTLLWSGIAEPAKAAACVKHLLGERLFSGWGVRTMAEADRGYNPIGYHVGTVWPFDNAIIAQGLARYGYRREAAQIATGILQAATYFRSRLPEAFAGYARSLTEYPVEYPTACSPQAWSTGAPLSLLRTILGLEPVGDGLMVNPVLPADLGWLGVFDIPGRWGRMDAFARSKETDRHILP